MAPNEKNQILEKNVWAVTKKAKGQETVSWGKFAGQVA